MDRRQLQQAVAEAQASIQMQAQQQLSERMHSICFKRCITAPTDKLADRQRRCLDQCLGAFQEGFGVAVRKRGRGAARRLAAAPCRLLPPCRSLLPPPSFLCLIAPPCAQAETLSSIVKRQAAEGGSE